MDLRLRGRWTITQRRCVTMMLLELRGRAAAEGAEAPDPAARRLDPVERREAGLVVGPPDGAVDGRSVYPSVLYTRYPGLGNGSWRSTSRNSCVFFPAAFLAASISSCARWTSLGWRARR